MRKILVTALTILCLAVFAGCSKDKPGGEQPGEVTKGATDGKTESKFESEDYEPGNRSYFVPRALMRTEKGFYHYNDRSRSFHYYDVTTGKEMFLCNKPECRHDGNPFCVATNQNYEILGNCLYNGRIVSYALEETETQYSFKLLAVALDGSSMDEIATVLTLEKMGEGMFFGGSEVHIHRNKVLLTMRGYQVGMTDTNYRGTAIVDLDTKEVMFLNEEPFGKNNVEITDISAYGNYFYYCQKEGKKTILHRYHITKGTDEICKLLMNFSGDYAVLDDDCVAYLRSNGTVLCTYRFSTGENEERVSLKRMYKEFPWENGEAAGEYETEYKALDLLTDGAYLYLPEGIQTRYWQNENGENETYVEAIYIHVFNQDLEEIKTVNLAEELPLAGFEEMEWHGQSYYGGVRYLGEDIYWCLSPSDNPEMTTYVFHCKRSDFLAGEPKFTFVYQYKEN